MHNDTKTIETLSKFINEEVTYLKLHIIVDCMPLFTKSSEKYNTNYLIY